MTAATWASAMICTLRYGAALVEQLRNAGQAHKRQLLNRLTAHQLRQMADVMDAFNTAAEAAPHHTVTS